MRNKKINIVFIKIFAVIIPVLWLAACSSGEYVRIKVVNSIPNNYYEVMKGGKNVGIVFLDSKKKLPDPSWEKILHAEMENSIRSLGYFNVIDIASRADRLKEITRSQTGLTSEAIEISKEFALDALIYLEVVNPPRSVCKTGTEKKLVPQKCPKNAKCPPLEVIITVKTLLLNIYISGKIVNIETGQSIAYTTTDAVPLVKKGEKNVECITMQEGFPAAAKTTSMALAQKLSPQISYFAAELNDDPLGSPESSGDKVKDLLNQGNTWAKNNPTDLKNAKEFWEKALKESGNRSAYAFWNLALAFWSEGNLSEAERLFNESFKNGGKKFANSENISIFDKFKSEKKRIELESRK